MSGEIRFAHTTRGSRKLVDTDGNFYIRNSIQRKHGKITEYWRCSNYRCPGRFVYDTSTGEGKITSPHFPEESDWKAKDAAIERLRDVTISKKGEEHVTAIQIVHQVLKEMTPAARRHMPTMIGLISRVKNWAKKEGVVLSQPKPTDYALESLEGLDTGGLPGIPTFNFGDDLGAPDQSGETGAAETGQAETSTNISLEKKKKKGLIFLKGHEKGRKKALIDGHLFLHVRDLKKGKRQYMCREDNCPVTAEVHRETKWYEITGDHVHATPTRKASKKGWLACLKIVDDDGAELDMDPSQIEQLTNENAFLGSSAEIACEEPSHIEADTFDDLSDVGLTEHDELDGHHPEPNLTQINQPTLKKDAVKCGEQCFICGDELILSESLSSNAEIFRKACCYLNVRSEKEWFPDFTPKSKYYSFCESCSSEITRIHGLYKKVEEIQSMIFKKVENVEKRIADAEIVDNWMADAPPSSVKRLDGFRKQVLINYRNKLRLRREVRVGRKLGNNFTEVDPVSSAHMFASDPADTKAYSKIHSSKNNLAKSAEKHEPDPKRQEPAGPKRKRGRPPKNRTLEATNPDTDSTPYEMQISTPVVEEHTFLEDADDSQVEILEHSDRDIKFDPNSVNVMDGGGASFLDEPDDYGDDNNVSDDPDFEINSKGVSVRKSRRKSAGSNKRPRLNQKELDEDRESDSCEDEDDCDDLDYELDNTQADNEIKKGRKSGSRRCGHKETDPTGQPYEFPEAVMRKDGRIYMEGIEIIKNPPGVYQRRPYSVSFSCGVCDKIVVTFWGIRQHICGHHLGMYTCPICHKQYSGPTIVKRHIEEKHSGKAPQRCPICEKPVKGQAKQLRWHMWSHLSEEEKKDPQFATYRPGPSGPKKTMTGLQTFMCSYCSKTFYSPKALKKHELTHTTEITHQCQICGSMYKTGKSLQEHVIKCERRQKGIKNVPTYPCPKCPTKRFTTRANQHKHIRRFHRNAKESTSLPWSCPKCPRSFSNRNAFISHRKCCVSEHSRGVSRSIDGIKCEGSAATSASLIEIEEETIDTDATAASTSTSGGASHGYEPREGADLLGFNYSLYYQGGNPHS